MLPNVPITRKYILAAEYFSDPNVGSLKGNMVDIMLYRVKANFTSVPP